MYPGKWAELTPDRVAVTMTGSGRSLTYRELNDNSLRTAHFLRDEMGLVPGDSIVVVSDNLPEVLELYWAGIRSGLYATFVNSHLTGEEADYIIENCGAKVLFFSANLHELAEHIQASTVERRFSFVGDLPGYERYETMRDAQSNDPIVGVPRGDSMLYSSGTTGRPKGIRRPLSGILVEDSATIELLLNTYKVFYGFGEDVTYLSPAPAYHAAPLAYMAMVQGFGGTVVMMERFDAEGVLQAIEKYNVTHSQMVPTMFVRLLKLDEDVRNKYDVSSLRTVIHAAAPCPVDVKRAMIDWWGPVLKEYYASTEAAGSTIIDSETWLKRPGSVGQAAPSCVVHICDDSGNELPPHGVGTVFFESLLATDRPFSYYNDEEKSKNAEHPRHSNWTTVGDLGYLDEEGFLFLTDRKSFMIISGGVNIYPQEIEDVFTLHPKIADIAVIGVKDDEMGERVVAFVQASPGTVGDDDLVSELTAYAREHLAGFKVPREFHFRDSLPRTPTGKMVKGKLKTEYELTHAG